MKSKIFVSLLLILAPILVASAAHAFEGQLVDDPEYATRLIAAVQAVRPMASGARGQLPLPSNSHAEWARFQAYLIARQRSDYVRGLSYIISGSLAIVGGQIGQSNANDEIEKGVYSLFQTIGIASVGYGAYVWKIGNEDRIFYESIANTPGIDDAARLAILRAFRAESKERAKNERFIRALTHGMVAAFNLYQATQQTSEPIKNAMFFIGGVNVLASVSYSF